MQPQVVYIIEVELWPVVGLKVPLVLSIRLKRHSARNSRFCIIAIMLLVGSAAAVYNADSLYLADDWGLSAQIPSVIAVGAGNTILVLTTDASGEPDADQPFTIDLTVNGTSIASLAGTTDADGLASPELYVPPFKGEAVLVVRSRDQELNRTVTAGTGSSFSRVFLTTDKPIYQPGQVVHARLLVLRKDLWAVGATPGALVTFEVKTPQGDRILRKTAQLDAFGVVSLDYPLSDQLPLGDYQFKAIVGGFEVARDVKVDEYVLPRFDISFGDLDRWYTFDDNIDAYALVKYFFGETVNGTARLQINVFDGSTWVTATDFDSEPLVEGAFEFKYDLDGLLPDYWMRNYGDRYYRYYDYQKPDSLTVELNLTVTDTGGHTESDSQVITIASGPILLTALTDVNIEGQTSNYYLVARYPDGMPVPNAVIGWSIERKDDGGSKTMPSVTTDARGVATLTFGYDEDFESMQVRASKDQYEAVANFYFKASHGIKAVPDRPTYAVGDVATFDVFHAGDPASDLLYYDVVADGFTITTGHITMSGDRATVRLPVTADFGHLTSVRFYRIERNFVIARDVATIGIAKDGGDLDITITPDSSTYLPKDDVSLELEVMRHGVGVPAMLGVSIVDNAVLELGARFTGFEEVLAGLGPFYTDPYYQLMGYILAGDVALPSQGYREWRREGVEPVESTGYELNAKAEAFKDDVVAAWWVVIGSAAVVGLIAVLAMGRRTRHWKVILAVLSLAIAPTLAVWGAVSNLATEQQDDTLGDGDGWDGIGPPPPPSVDDRAMEAGGGFGFDLPDIFNSKDEAETTGQGSDQGIVSPSGGYTVPTKRGSVRQFFPETWAWVPVLPTDDSGVATLELVAPDSITSWDVSVIASTQSALVGVAHQNVTVFQEFFVEPDLPARAFLGDRFPLKVQVYNYGAPTAVEVRLAPTSWFRVEDTNHAILEVGKGEVASVEFTVTMLEVGVHEVRVTGESATFVDTVVRTLRVKPAGEHVTDMFQGMLMPGDSLEHTFAVLPEMVPNSQNAWVKLQGGIEAVVMEGAESYIHMVSGCGEQSMSGLSVDVLAFLAARQGGLAEDQLIRLEAIVNQGIQYEMKFLYDDGEGRGIVYYPGERSVNPWLTAWGLQTFSDAKAGGFDIDDDILLDMRQWLKAHQSADGHFDFAEWRYYGNGDPYLEKRQLATTAYITKAMLQSGMGSDDAAVQSAMNYITQVIKVPTAWEDSYVLALGLRALVAGGRGGEATAREVADRLHEMRVVEGNHTYWGSSTNMISYEQYDGVGARELLDKNPGYVVETTGYAAQALYAMGSYITDVRGAMRFLVEGRSQYGGWHSTQDTVVAFQTVWQVSTTVADVDMDVEVLVDGDVAFTQSFDASNSDMTYLLDLRPLLGPATTTVTVRGTGAGSIIFQAFLEQWVPWRGGADVPLELTVDYADVVVRVDETLGATARLTNRQDQPIKMALVELVAPVGTRLVTSQFEDLYEHGVVDYVEWADGAVRLYITDLSAGESVQFTYSLLGTMPADVTIAGNRAFDMYNSLVITELEPIEISVYIP